MKKIWESISDLKYLLIIPVLSSLYPILNHAPRGAKSLMTDLDRIVPFTKEFIIPYVLWYPFIFICLFYFCFKDKKVYYRTLGSIILGMIVSYTIFFIFQTTVPRPFIEGDDLFSKLIGILWRRDNPYNCFPSLHVLESYLMIKGINTCSDKSKAAVVSINFMAWLIIAATQFIKQHVILDALGAIYLGEIIFNGIPNTARFLSFFVKKKLKYTTNQ